MSDDLWVVVPAFNEEALVETCLESLAAQTDTRFGVVVVDNSSTDRTPEIVDRWFRSHPEKRGVLTSESRKGTGAAADTGFRHAISFGADWVARTDADCVVDRGWVAAVRAGSRGAEMLGGKTRPRTDQGGRHLGERIYLPLTVSGARLVGRVRPSNRGAQYQCAYVMCVGNNLAVESGTYLASGGFPRVAIEEMSIPNDRALVNRVRQVSSLVRYAPNMVVYNSVRRLRSYGLLRTLRWYADHTLDTQRFEVDIR